MTPSSHLCWQNGTYESTKGLALIFNNEEVEGEEEREGSALDREKLEDLLMQLGCDVFSFDPKAKVSDCSQTFVDIIL